MGEPRSVAQYPESFKGATRIGQAPAACLAAKPWLVAKDGLEAPDYRGHKVDSATLSSRDFLTEQALRDLEKNETAYRHSIEALSRLAEPKLSGPTSSPILLSYREKLLMLDSAILETRSNVTQNRFNMRLQTELADLYLEKRQTLQEILTDGQRN
jgi:hypothetical protein